LSNDQHPGRPATFGFDPRTDHKISVFPFFSFSFLFCFCVLHVVFQVFRPHFWRDLVGVVRPFFFPRTPGQIMTLVVVRQGGMQGLMTGPSQMLKWGVPRTPYLLEGSQGHPPPPSWSSKPGGMVRYGHSSCGCLPPLPSISIHSSTLVIPLGSACFKRTCLMFSTRCQMVCACLYVPREENAFFAV
jgi:hypothetical protein